jgi:hypothetical protein
MSVKNSTPMSRRSGANNAHDPASHWAKRPPPMARVNSAVSATIADIASAGSNRKPRRKSPKMACDHEARHGTMGGWST